MLLLAWSAAVATNDCRYRRIPNALLWPMLLLIVAMLAVGGQGPLEQGLMATLSGAAVSLLLVGSAYLIGAVGAGDVKFAAVTGAILGPIGSGVALLISSLLLGLQSAVARARGGQQRQPMGPALAAGFGAVIGLLVVAGR